MKKIFWKPGWLKYMGNLKKTGVVFFLLCLVLSACNSKKEIAAQEAPVLPDGVASVDGQEESNTGQNRILLRDDLGTVILKNTTWLCEISADKQSRIIFKDNTATNDIVEYTRDEPSLYRGAYTYRIEGNQIFFEKQDDTLPNRVVGVKSMNGVTNLVFSPGEKDTLQIGTIDNGTLAIGTTVFMLQQGNLDFLSWTTWETGEIDNREYKLEFKEGRVTFISVEYIMLPSPPYVGTSYMTYPYTVNETDKTFLTQQDIYEGRVSGDTLTITYTPDVKDYDAPKIGQVFKKVK